MTSSAAVDVRALYLDTIERVLLNTIYRDASVDSQGREQPYDPAARAEGRVWPTRALTMIGEKRLHHLRRCVEEVLADGIPGDLLEAGVWRGGASIMMRAVLVAHGVTDRRVWVADSFRGLPPPDGERYPLDAGLDLSEIAVLAVPRDVVQANFEALGLFDESVRFVEGWFSETLTTIDADAFALLRLDGDLYESTLQTLEALYPKLSPGGFAIVDDYGAVPACAAAVHAYRERHGVHEPIETIDWTGVYWRKST
ncbi:MAG: TylF/MycF family methyltransferase [Candidatus Eremiobacteraeota bacterium]|nr:TylF/MycF family methyltransferase [Candidatus Eremiobacteraeota bacterium]